MILRAFFLCLGVGLTSACGNLPFAGVGEGQTNVAGTYAALARADAAAIRVDLLQSQAASALLRLSIRDGVETYIAPDGPSFAFRDGFLIATRGLGGDLMSSEMTEVSTLVLSRQEGRATRHASLLNGEDRIELRSFVCDIRADRQDGIETIRGLVQATLMIEDCAARDLRVVNTYWVSGLGEIVSSRQWAGEFAGPATFIMIDP